MMEEGLKSEFHHDRTGRPCRGGQMVARANICATGVEWRRLNLPTKVASSGAVSTRAPGASEAPLCSGEDVFVIGPW